MQPLSWQQQLSKAIETPVALLQYVGLDAHSIGYSDQAIQQFPVRVPHSFADRITKGDPNDPILRQIFPYTDEAKDSAAYIDDPLAEKKFLVSPGLLHKYKSRVLSITTGVCAIHCRYCFRRHFPYHQSASLKKYWQQSLAYIQRDVAIDEVILSGGDPLSLSDNRIIELLDSMVNIEHIKRIRIHTRMPIVLPDRVSKRLVKALANYSKAIVFVLHVNHVNELGGQVENSIQLLRQSGANMFNQSVLLKGVNDNYVALTELSKGLISFNIHPYYLHILDPVSGAAHYEVSLVKARDLITKMKANISGYLIPKLVREDIGSKGKTVITA